MLQNEILVCKLRDIMKSVPPYLWLNRCFEVWNVLLPTLTIFFTLFVPDEFYCVFVPLLSCSIASAFSLLWNLSTGSLMLMLLSWDIWLFSIVVVFDSGSCFWKCKLLALMELERSLAHVGIDALNLTPALFCYFLLLFSTCIHVSCPSILIAFLME